MREGFQVAVVALLAASVAGLAVLVGCEPASRPPSARPPRQGAASDERDYLAPPDLLGVALAAGGGLQLTGHAEPSARVRLATPQGAAVFAQTDASGGWRLVLPPLASPQLLGLSMSVKGRIIQAQGYIFLAPDGTAARLRAGGGSESAGAPPAGLAVTAIDYDAMLATMLSGRAEPGAVVDVRVDNAERGQSNADRAGRFVVSINQPLTAGPHALDVSAPSGAVHLAATFAPPAPLTAAPFRAEKTASGWRLDWLTPGGGEQTTLLVARPA